MYFSASSLRSSMPLARSVKLSGHQITPTVLAEVPPKNGSFSIRIAESPFWRAVTAAVAAPSPLPTATMSAS